MLYTRHKTHPDHPPIRVRLAHSGDRRAVDALLERHARTDELQAGRLLRHDPRRTLVLCATVWDGGHEQLVGVSAAAMRPGARPEVLVSDEDGAPGAADALAEATARRVALAG